MKKNYLYLVLALSLVAAIFFGLKRPALESRPIPPLLNRQGPISVTSEWLNTRAAIQGLQTKIRQKPDDYQSKLLLAFAYMQEARTTGEHPYYYPAALQLVEDVLDHAPANPVIRYEALVAKASIELSQHQFSRALETANQALRIQSRSASVYGVLCDAQVELGNYAQAIEMADKMAALRPDLKSYSRVSYLREIHGDLPGAIAAMEMAVAAGYPGLEQTAWARVSLGSLYEKTGDLKKAENHYRRALSEYPHYAFALAGLGRIAEKQHQNQQALQYYTQAAEIIPEFSFQEALVRLYQRQGKSYKASRELKALLASLKEDQQAGHVVDLELANIYLELGQDHTRAYKFALKEYKRRPGNIDVCRTLAHIFYKRQEFDKASAYIRKASRTKSQDPALLCLQGLIAYKSGNQVQGKELIRQSLATDPYQNSPLSQEGRRLLGKEVASR